MADWLIGDCRCSCVLFDFSGASGVFSPRPRCLDRHGAETRLRGNHPYHLVDFVSIFCITGFFCWLLYFVASSRAQKKSNLIKMFILPILSLKNKIKIQILLKTWSQKQYLSRKQKNCTKLLHQQKKAGYLESSHVILCHHHRPFKLKDTYKVNI